MVGWRQRVQREAAAREASRSRSPRRPGSHSLEAWLSEWGWGKCSASDLVRRAHSHVQDHGPRRLDEGLVRLSRSINNLGNAERIVESILPLQDVPGPVVIDGSSMSHVLLPDAYFHWLRTCNPRKFYQHCVAYTEGFESWWQGLCSSAEGRQFWDQHPHLAGRRPQDLKRHLPLMIFDDAGPVSKNNSTFCRCWFSLVGLGNEQETRFLIATCLKDEEGPDLSWPVVMESFAKLAAPLEDASSFGGILLFLGGDLEYTCNVVGL